MSTLTWLARSCLSVCWLTLDDHELTSSPHRTMKNMAFDKKNEKGFNSTCNSKEQLNNPIIKDKNGGFPIGNKFDHSSWSLTTDEDYIVFCFGKDVAQECKGVKSEPLDKSLNEMHKKSRPANSKLKYGEDEEQVSELNIHGKRSNANQHNDQDSVVHYYQYDITLQEEERVRVHMSTQQHRGSIRRECQFEGIEGSDQSEGSRSSFAFPVLGWEWIGSPVQMPKSEGLHLRKHKARAVRFQCCTF